MPSLWDSDEPKYRRNVSSFLPHEVVLRDDQWFTIQMRTDMGVPLDEPIVMPGLDVGGVIHLTNDIHTDIVDGPAITSYVIGRRGKKAMDVMKLMANDDEFRRKPRDLTGIKYDVVISFKTDAEAVSFALMFS